MSSHSTSGPGNPIYQPGELDSEVCSHLDQVQSVTPSADGCEDCLKMGSFWIRLRLCMVCGHVGCCDDSLHKHARKHFHSSGHPLVQSWQPGETWVWCFADDVLVHK